MLAKKNETHEFVMLNYCESVLKERANSEARTLVTNHGGQLEYTEAIIGSRR